MLSDIGGYAAGVLFGKHPMAPSVSPKKSWEGFAGSVVACVVGGVALVVRWLLDGPWWAGVVLGAVAAVGATLGDLCESMIKRDLGIKDMGSILPGHGGLMDRLDSLLHRRPRDLGAAVRLRAARLRLALVAGSGCDTGRDVQHPTRAAPSRADV